ncbi:MAG: hypothetical protein WBD30_16385, partial [Bacteroidota bacterium]
MSVRLLLVAGLLVQAALLSFYAVPGSAAEVLHFIVVNAFVFGVCGFLVYLLRSSNSGGGGKRRLAIIFGFAVLFRLTLVPHAPVASDDIYRYLWDGKVAAHGINPFEFAPEDPRLAHLESENLPAKVSFPEMRTIYPPLAQAVFL